MKCFLFTSRHIALHYTDYLKESQLKETQELFIPKTYIVLNFTFILVYNLRDSNFPTLYLRVSTYKKVLEEVYTNLICIWIRCPIDEQDRIVWTRLVTRTNEVFFSSWLLEQTRY